MYTKYAVQLDRGYTSREFMDACNSISGKNMDDFFSRYVYGFDSIPYQQYLDVMGLQLSNLGVKGNAPFLGITTTTDRRVTVKSVERNSPAWNDGLNVNDEIIAINGIRLDDDLNHFMSMFKPGDKFSLLISRNNEIREIQTTLARDPHAKYVLEPVKNQSEAQRAKYKSWLALTK
jgi:predicted metalloprotease with PDZ domain